MSAVREVDQLFGRISRYTRFVLFGKWTLLVVALLLIGSLISWPLVSKDRSGLRISFVDNKTAKPQKPMSPVMDSPEYEGVNEKGQQYKVNGKVATQKSATLIEIEQVEAQLLKADSSWFLLTSTRAEYKQDVKVLDLFGDVTLMNDRHTFSTEHATIETNTMRVFGNDPITGSGPMGKIVASGFEIKDNGEHIIFVGGVEQLRVTIDRSGKKK